MGHRRSLLCSHFLLKIDDMCADMRDVGEMLAGRECRIVQVHRNETYAFTHGPCSSHEIILTTIVRKSMGLYSRKRGQVDFPSRILA